MSDYITDPELLKKLNGETAPAEQAPVQQSTDQGYVTDPELLSQLGTPEVQSAVAPTGSAVGAVAPAVTGAAYAAPTGLGQLAKDAYGAVAPVVSTGVKNAVAGYAKNPLGAVADAVLLHGGLPPAYGTVKSVQGGYDAFKAGKEIAKNLSEAFTHYGSGADEAAKWVNALKPEDSAKFLEAANKNGIDNTLKNFKAPAYLSEEATAALNATKNAVPTTMSKIGAVAGPLARGAGRVLGPAGMAMNVYDAGQTARETDLGGRLATGEAQRAPQAFTGMLNRNVSGYTPSAQEARNILDSGDERTINMYGGRLKLQGLASPGPNAFNSGFAQELNRLGR